MAVAQPAMMDFTPSREVRASGSTLGLVLGSRTVLFTLAYFAAAGALAWLGAPDAWSEARAWWPVTGLGVNAVSLVWLAQLTRREGRPLASLVGFDRARLRGDLLTCLWAIPASAVLAVGANLALKVPFYGLAAPMEQMSLAPLPTWALVVGVVLFPLVNGVVEELTYNGYVYPRVEARLGPLSAVVWVTAVFSLQHVAVPFDFDLKFLAWRVLSFVPLLLFWVLLYRWLRRLPALFVTHAVMDAFALTTLVVMP